MRKSQTLLAVVLFSCSANAHSRGPLDLATAPVPAGAVRSSYGDDPIQFGELRVPTGDGPHPVAIVVHGGCWLAQLGDMDPRAVSMANMRPAAAALSEAGIATWNVEYRRLGHEGGGWPGTFHDVANAADHLRSLADEHQLDLNRTIAIGHSSGGQLAMWLAAREQMPPTSDLHKGDPLRLTGVVNLDGPVDLRSMLEQQEAICGRPVVTDLIGGTPAEKPERYQQASPVELLPLGVPQAYFAGQMFESQVSPYAAEVSQFGEQLETIVLASGGHFIFIDPLSDEWPRVLSSVRRLLSLPE